MSVEGKQVCQIYVYCYIHVYTYGLMLEGSEVKISF